jgi:cytosine deaminase
LLSGYLLGETQYMGSAEQQRALLRMVTTNAAKALNIEDHYGLDVGKQADLCILNSYKLSDVIQDQPIRAAVIKSGRIVVETQLDTRYPTGMP